MMTLEEFGSWARAKGYLWLGSNAYGTYRGYPFSVYLKSGKVSALTVSFRLAKALNGKAFRTLRKSLAKGCSLLAPTGDRMDLVVAGTDEAVEENFRTAMDQVTQALTEAGITPPEKCPYCKQGGCDSLSALGGGSNGKNVNYAAAAGGVVGMAVAQATAPATGYVPVHRSCVEQRAGDAVAQAEVNTATGSRLTGLIGAILGGVVGAIPSVIVYFMGYYVAILYALIPLAAYQGYKLFKGKMDHGAFWCTLLSSILQLFVIEQAIFYVMIVTEWHLWPSVLETVSLYFQLMTPADILVDMLQSILFLGLGIWLAWGQIRRTSTHEVLDMTTAVETLAPYRSASTPDL